MVGLIRKSKLRGKQCQSASFKETFHRILVAGCKDRCQPSLSPFPSPLLQVTLHMVQSVQKLLEEKRSARGRSGFYGLRILSSSARSSHDDQFIPSFTMPNEAMKPSQHLIGFPSSILLENQCVTIQRPESSQIPKLPTTRCHFRIIAKLFLDLPDLSSSFLKVTKLFAVERSSRQR
jgi:hypothetical protein